MCVSLFPPSEFQIFKSLQHYHKPFSNLMYVQYIKITQKNCVVVAKYATHQTSVSFNLECLRALRNNIKNHYKEWECPI